jgi:predicted nucleic acid-binding protein
MNSIQDEVIALDTNEFIFALRQEPSHASCETLLFDKLPELRIYMPLQVLVELQRNLNLDEMRGIFLVLNRSKTIQWDYAPAPLPLIAKWEGKGAKKGDAVIAAHLENAKIPYLVSENRDFLVEIPDLPFKVITAAEVVKRLESRIE